MNRQDILALVKTTQHKKIQKLNDTDLERLVFKRPDTLRLNYDGMVLLCKTAKSYAFNHSAELHVKHLIGLSQFKFPYYLSKTKLVLFGEEDALLITLHGSVEKYLEKLNQFKD